MILNREVMLPTYWFSVWWCFWGAPVASVSISCPSCSATEGVVRNGKSTAGHQRYLCSHCRKTWQLQFTYTASQTWYAPENHWYGHEWRWMPGNCPHYGVGLNTILRHLKTQAAVGNLAHTAGQWRHRLRGNGRTVGLCRAALAVLRVWQSPEDGCCARIRWTHYGDAGASYEPAVTLWRGDMDDGWLAAVWIPPEGKAARNQQAIYAANWAA